MSNLKSEYVSVKIKQKQFGYEEAGRTLVIDPNKKGVVSLLGAIGHWDEIVVTEELIEALKKALPEE